MREFIRNLLKCIPTLLLIVGCTQSEEPNVVSSETTLTTRAVELEEGEIDENILFFSSTVATRMEIAQWFAKNYSLTEAHRIHQAVKQSHSLGLDEIYYLKEFAAQSSLSNKVVQAEPSELSKKFRSDFQGNNITNISGNPLIDNQQISDLFNHERLEIYWPYSDNWDGVTTPVVAYAPRSLSALNTIGFKYGNSGFMARITVDEEYCQNHPVWLITESETPYYLLPNLARGEAISSDGIFFSQDTNSSTDPQAIDAPLDSVKISDKGIITTVKLGYVRSEKNHDNIFAGGSEYVFKFATLTNTDLTCEADTNKCERIYAQTRVCFTRNEIKHKTQKDLNAIVVSSWPKSLDNIAMTLIEEDWGKKEVPYEAKLYVTWANTKYGFEVSIPRTNLDDKLAERIYARDFIVSTNNYEGEGKWCEDTSDGVYWTLPYKIGTALDYDPFKP